MDTRNRKDMTRRSGLTSSRNNGNQRSRRRFQNPAQSSYESTGPDGVKVRGLPSQICERYKQLSRDAATSGDRVLAENLLQYAEHYLRLVGRAQEALKAKAILEDAQASEDEESAVVQGNIIDALEEGDELSDTSQRPANVKFRPPRTLSSQEGGEAVGDAIVDAAAPSDPEKRNNV